MTTCLLKAGVGMQSRPHVDNPRGGARYLATLAAMEKPVHWMTLAELRDQLERTRPAWEDEAADLDEVLLGSKIPALSEEAHRHQQLAKELMRRPS